MGLRSSCSYLQSFVSTPSMHPAAQALRLRGRNRGLVAAAGKGFSAPDVLTKSDIVDPESGWPSLSVLVLGADSMSAGRLALDQPARLQQRSLQRSHITALREEQAMAKEWHSKVEEDRIDQKHNIKSLHRAIKQSYDFGGPRYTHVAPAAGSERPPAYASALKTLERTSDVIAHARQEQGKLEATAKTELEDTAGRITTFDAWFARYGQPIRQSTSCENLRTFATKPRSLPHQGTSSSAVHLRLGSAIWNDKSVLRTLRRPPDGRQLA